MSDQKEEFDEVLSADDLDDLDMLLDELDETEARKSESNLAHSSDDSPVENEADVFDALDELTLDDFIDESEDPEVDSGTPHQETDGETTELDKTIESDNPDEATEQTITHDIAESDQNTDSGIINDDADNDPQSSIIDTENIADVNTENDTVTEPVDEDQTDEVVTFEEKSDVAESAATTVTAADAATAAAASASAAADAATTAASAATSAADAATAAAGAATTAAAAAAEADADANDAASAADAAATAADDAAIAATDAATAATAADAEQQSQAIQETETSEQQTAPHKEEDDEDALSELFGDKPSAETSVQEREELSLQDNLPKAADEISDETEVIETDELTDLPLDEIDSNPARAMESDADALEKDIESLLDSNRNPSEETSAPIIDLAEKETDMPNKAQQSETEGSKTQKPGINLNMANSITMSLGLIAVLVAALALWFGLDASQQTDSLKAKPQKMQQQIDQMQEQMDAMQQQVNGLTQVVANKSTENWQEADTADTPAAGSETPTTLANPGNIEKQALPTKDGTANAPVKTDAVIKKPLKAKLITRQQKPVTAKKAPSAKTTRRQFSSPYEVAAGSVKGWAVNMMSYETARAAELEVRRLRTKDVKAEFVQVPIKGKTWFRVRVSGFHTERDAVAYEKYMTEFQAIDVWHHKLN